MDAESSDMPVYSAVRSMCQLEATLMEASHKDTLGPLFYEIS